MAGTFGAVSGVFKVAANSITNPTNTGVVTSGSGAVNVGDLVYVVVGEDTSTTATAVTDNLGNSYAATQAGTDAGTSTGRAFWSRVTVAGTITNIAVTATASTDNVAIVAAIFSGPFLASPLDANPTNITTDITSPFTCPATGTLAQAQELVVTWGVATGSTVWAATSPNTLIDQQATQTVIHTVLASQVVRSTGTISPAFTAASNPTDAVLATTSFKASIAEEWWDHFQLPSLVPQGKKLATALVAMGVASGAVAPVAPVVNPTGSGDVLFSQTHTAQISQGALLYQSIAEPVQQAPVNVSQWLQAWGTPQRKPRYPESIQVFVPVISAPTPGTGDVLFSQTGTAQTAQSALLYQSVADPVPIVQTAPFGWLAPFSEPVRQKRGLAAYEQQSLAFVKAAPFPESVSIDRWLLPLAEPTRAKRLLQEGGPSFVPVVVAPSPGTGDVLFTQTTFTLRYERALLYQAYTEVIQTTAAPVTVNVGWLTSFSLPPDGGVGIISLTSTFFSVDPSFGWYAALNEPIRRQPRTAESVLSFVPVVAAPTPGTGDVLFAQTQTTLRYERTFLYQSVADAVNFSSAPTTPSYGWYQPFSQPLYKRAGLPTPEQQAIAFVPVVTGPTPGTGDVLFSQTPVTIIYQRAFLYQSVAEPAAVVRPYIDPGMASWSYQWTGPVRLRPGLSTAAQPSGGIPPQPVPPNPPGPTGQYTVSGLYVIDQFTNNTVVYDYNGGVSHRTN